MSVSDPAPPTAPVRPAEARVAVLEAMLEDRAKTIHELEQKLAALQDGGEAASRIKSEFLARMSHEIRTPLNAIIGLTTLALRTELDDKQSDYLGKILVASRSLLGLVNDLMDYTRIESRRLELAAVPFHLQDVLGRLLERFASLATEKKVGLDISIAPDVPTALVGDHLRLGQILGHLVDNAIKFTTQGEVTVVVSQVSDASRRVTLRFVVKDTGVGIAPETLQSLFEPFAQADTSTTRTAGGAGIGLTLCTRLVELMGGKITVTSLPGQGSEFAFVIAFDLKPVLEGQEFLVPQWLRGKRILIVDDDHATRTFLLTTLRKFFFEAQAVDSGEAALLALTTTEPCCGFDLVLLDFMLPGLDGLATAARIRAPGGPWRDIPIVMLSAHSRDEIAIKADQLGVNFFLLKPVSQSLLFDTLVQVFKEADPGVATLPAAVSKLTLRAENALRGAKVLLVEDNPVNQQVAREIMEHWGIRVHTVADGRQAVDTLELLAFDAVLMDIEMPRMDGVEATRRIRENPKCKGLPIIALTAHALEGDRERCLDAGMNDYLTKPVDAQQLFAMLAQWIQPELATPAPRPKVSTTVQAPEAAPADAQPAIDIADTLKRFNGDHVLFIKILKEFRRSYTKGGAELRALIRADDSEGAKRFAHTLKGVAGNIGAKPLAAASKAVELAYKLEATERLELLTTTLDQVLLETLDAAKTILDAQPTLPDPLPRLHVLFVDDSRLNRAIFSDLLIRLGHRVDTASDGKEACIKVFGESSQAQPFDLILMDIEMPEMDGVKAATTIRKVLQSSLDPPCRPDIPIIAMTSHDPEVERPRCLAAGMDDCLDKAFDQTRLGDILARFYREKIGPARSEKKQRTAPGSTPGAGPEKPDQRALAQAVSYLADCLRKGSLDADKALTQLKQTLPDAAPRERMLALEESVETFEYRAALVLLAELASAYNITLPPSSQDE